MPLFPPYLSDIGLDSSLLPVFWGTGNHFYDYAPTDEEACGANHRLLLGDAVKNLVLASELLIGLRVQVSLHFLSTGRFIVLQLSVSVFTESSFNVLVVLLPTINR